MMTIDKIESNHDELELVWLDKNDDGLYYIKQDDDWIALTLEMLIALEISIGEYCEWPHDENDGLE